MGMEKQIITMSVSFWGNLKRVKKIEGNIFIQTRIRMKVDLKKEIEKGMVFTFIPMATNMRGSIKRI